MYVNMVCACVSVTYVHACTHESTCAGVSSVCVLLSSCESIVCACV